MEEKIEIIIVEGGEKGDRGDTGTSIVDAKFIGDDIVFTQDDGGEIVLEDVKDKLKGDTGIGISSIVKTGTNGLVDTYTITYTDNSTDTFDITNGEDGNDGTDGVDGVDGKSAYQIWLDEGNTGSEQDFLDSLKGEDGEDGEDGVDGKSAYQIWLNEGNTGSEQDFLNSLKGEDGNDGIDGVDGEDGKSAYQIWLDEGNTGSEQDFLNSMKGKDGEDGIDGEDGKSAYQIWLDEGNTGTEQDFIDSLKGEDGEDGKSAYQIWLDEGNTGTEQDFIDSLKGDSFEGPATATDDNLVVFDGDTGTKIKDGGKKISELQDKLIEGDNITIEQDGKTIKAKDTTYSTITTAEIDTGTATTSRTVSAKVLRDKFYTESEIDTKLSGKADSSHTHTKSEITDLGLIGDMSKSTYDTNNNGSVDKADKLLNQSGVAQALWTGTASNIPSMKDPNTIYLGTEA